MSHIIQVLGSASAFLANEGSVIGTVLGIGLMIYSKLKSTEEATGLIAVVQGFFDGLASAFSAAGSFFKGVADLMANVLKSDGVLGKK